MEAVVLEPLDSEDLVVEGICRMLEALSVVGQEKVSKKVQDLLLDGVE